MMACCAYKANIIHYTKILSSIILPSVIWKIECMPGSAILYLVVCA